MNHFIITILFLLSLSAYSQSVIDYNNFLEENKLSNYLQADSINVSDNVHFLCLSVKADSVAKGVALLTKLGKDYINITGSNFRSTLYFGWLYISNLSPEYTAIMIYFADIQLMTIGIDPKTKQMVCSISMAEVDLPIFVEDFRREIQIDYNNIGRSRRKVYALILNKSRDWYVSKGGNFSSPNFNANSTTLTFEVCNLRGVILPNDKTWVCDLINYFYDDACDLRAYEYLKYRISYIQNNQEGITLTISVEGRFAPAYGYSCNWENATKMEDTIWDNLLQNHLGEFRNLIEQTLTE